MWFKILVRKTKNNLFLICYDSKGKALTNVSGGMTGAKGSSRLSPASAFSAGKLLVEKISVLDKFKEILSQDNDEFSYQMASLKKNLKYGIRYRNSLRILEQGALLKQASSFSEFLMGRFFFIRENFFLEQCANFPFVSPEKRRVDMRLGKIYNPLFKGGFLKIAATFNEGSYYIPARRFLDVKFARISNRRRSLKKQSILLTKLLKVRSLGLIPFRRKLLDSSLGLWDVLKERRDSRLRRKLFRRNLKRRRRGRKRRRRSKYFLKNNKQFFLRRSFFSQTKSRLFDKIGPNSAYSVQIFPFLYTLKLRNSKNLLRKNMYTPFKKNLSSNLVKVLPLLSGSKRLFLRPLAFYSVGFVKRYKKASAFVRKSTSFYIPWRTIRYLKRKTFYKVNPPFWRRRSGIKFLLLRKKLPVFHFSQVRESLKPFVFLVASTRMDQNIRAAMRGVITHFPKIIRIFGFFRVPHNGVRAKKQRRL